MSKEALDAVKEINTAWEAFKTTNDERLTQIEKRGEDPITTDKLGKIEATLIQHETANQKIALADAAAKKATDEVAQLTEALAKLEAKLGRPVHANDADANKQRATEYKNAFDNYLRKTDNGITAEERKALQEYKVLFAGNDTLGGYYLSPAEMATEIIKQVILMSPIRALGRVTTIGVQSLKLPKRTGVFAATRVGELQARNETLGYATGMVEIFAPEMYAEVHLSEQMIEDSMFDIESEMMQEFSEQFAVKEGIEFVKGTGANNQAEGIMTSSQLATTNFSGSATTIADAGGQANGLITMFYSGLKTAYAKNASWILRRETIGSVRKMKDLYGSYIWQIGVAADKPNTILGVPYVEVPDMDLEGAGNYPIAVGDFNKGYRIVDRVLISVLRDPFTIAGSGQILYRARKRVGGAVVLGEAIAKLQCHV